MPERRGEERRQGGAEMTLKSQTRGNGSNMCQCPKKAGVLEGPGATLPGQQSNTEAGNGHAGEGHATHL